MIMKMIDVVVSRFLVDWFLDGLDEFTHKKSLVVQSNIRCLRKCCFHLGKTLFHLGKMMFLLEKTLFPLCAKSLHQKRNAYWDSCVLNLKIWYKKISEEESPLIETLFVRKQKTNFICSKKWKSLCNPNKQNPWRKMFKSRAELVENDKSLQQIVFQRRNRISFSFENVP